jgi:hypothetical protein
LRYRALGPDPLQQKAGGFVGRVLQHEFVPERLVQHRLIEVATNFLALVTSEARRSIHEKAFSIQRAALAGLAAPQSDDQTLADALDVAAIHLSRPVECQSVRPRIPGNGWALTSEPALSPTAVPLAIISAFYTLVP